MDKKTSRKNQTKLQVNWPSEDAFWTVKDLWKANPQFIAEITLRVRLANAIKKQNTVAVIGDKMNSHGRPEMVCAMRQKDGTVKQTAIDAAKNASIRITESTSIVAHITPPTAPATKQQTATVNLNPTQVQKPVTV